MRSAYIIKQDVIAFSKGQICNSAHPMVFQCQTESLQIQNKLNLANTKGHRGPLPTRTAKVPSKHISSEHVFKRISVTIIENCFKFLVSVKALTFDF